MMVIELVEGDESRVRWNYGDGWHYADIDDLIRAYESVRHGRWRKERNPMMYQVVPYVYVCDQCGTAFEYGTPYCGECGAKMDERGADDEVNE